MPTSFVAQLDVLMDSQETLCYRCACTLNVCPSVRSEEIFLEGTIISVEPHSLGIKSVCCKNLVYSHWCKKYWVRINILAFTHCAPQPFVLRAAWFNQKHRVKLCA